MAHITFDKFMEIKIKEREEIVRKEGEEIGIKKGEKIEKEKSRKKQMAAQKAVIENFLRKFPDLNNHEIAEIAQADIELVQKIRKELK